MSPFLLRRLSDELLGSRLASGDAAAFDELYRRYVHRLGAYGAHLLGDVSAGDDVAQSSLLKAYGALRDGTVPDRVRPWLYRIAHNTAIDLAVRRRELPVEHLPEQATGTTEPAGALVAALAALPDRQRHVFVLRELHGLRIDETAAELGLTAQQVEQALFAARNRMAEHLTFGDRLNCVAVRRLAAGPLDTDERRALKAHLRSCSGCRQALGLRGRALGLVPAATFEWLRGLATTLIGGTAPVATKLGAAVATATIAAGVPGAIEVAKPHAQGEPRFHGIVEVASRTQQPVRRVAAAQRRPIVRERTASAAAAPAAVRQVFSERRPRTSGRAEARHAELLRAERRRVESPESVQPVEPVEHRDRGPSRPVPVGEPTGAQELPAPSSEGPAEGPASGAPPPAVVTSTTTMATTTTATTTTVQSGSGDGGDRHEGSSDGGSDGGSGRD